MIHGVFQSIILVALNKTPDEIGIYLAAWKDLERSGKSDRLLEPIWKYVMYDEYKTAPSSVPLIGKGCKYVLIATVAAYILQLLVDGNGVGPFSHAFGLSRPGIKSLYLWQFVTYMFVHGSMFHILMNMLWFYFMGRDVEDALGTARFLILYFGSGVMGGLLWLLFTKSNIPCVGASGGVFGLLGAFGAIYAERRITLLVAFIIPLNITGRMLAIGAGILTLLSMSDGSSGIAHVAHLGGGVAGYAYGWYIRKKKGFLFGTAWSRWTPFSRGAFRDFLRKRKIKLMDPDPDYRPEKAEVDEILEKVASQGMWALSRWERKILDRASRNGVR